MNVNKSDMVAQLLTLPRRFHDLENLSVFSLLEATGYFGLHDQISEEDIRAGLVRCPDCVQEWLQYSEDKRTNGWYVLRNDEGRYEVGYVTEKGDLEKREFFDNESDACAAFIKLEIESIRLG